MNIALVGYGKMGKAIEQIAIDRGHTISAAIGLDNKDEIYSLNSTTTDVVIEFTQPESAYNNIKTCLEQGIPVVSGTTGWLEHQEEIEALCKEKKGAFFYASNFSIGVNLFFSINKTLAKLMNGFQDEYEVNMEEIHHIHKKDAPSGTAITLAEGITENFEKKKGWQLDNTNSDLIHINAVRENEVPGTHIINYVSEIDQIEIKHEAFSRKGFSTGAVVAAEWIKGKEGIFGMNDLLKL